jgi:hypothetical protein
LAERSAQSKPKKALMELLSNTFLVQKLMSAMMTSKGFTMRYNRLRFLLFE